MERLYYALLYRLDGVDAYLIWYCNGRNGLICNPAGRLVTFTSEADICAYASRQRIQIEEEEPFRHNLDMVSYWVDETRATSVDCDLFLAVWNLFSDVIAGMKHPPINFEDPHYARLYQKLYWCSSQPAYAKGEAHYKPEWTEPDLETLRSLLGTGLRTFRAQLSGGMPRP